MIWRKLQSAFLKGRNHMNMVAISFSEKGAEQILDLKKKLNTIEIDGYCKYRSANDVVIRQTDVDKTNALIEKCFAESTPILFICACGIAVRLIAPYMKDKLTDPPVIVMDEMGEHVIPILSGHVGGANELAVEIAGAIGAIPVITTATDVNSTFSIDSFARENRLTIRNKDGIKKVSSKILKGEPIRIQVDTEVFGEVSDDTNKAGYGTSCTDYDVVITSDKHEIDNTSESIHGYNLWLYKKRYVLGIGCKKGKTLEEIEEKVQSALTELGIDYSDIYAFGSIDLKAEEKGLLALSQKHRIPFVTFTSEMLQKAKGDFDASDFVKEKTGVDNVCERAAMLLTLNRGKLVLRKQASDGVTVAVALRSHL